MNPVERSSRLPGFHRLGRAERIDALAGWLGQPRQDIEPLLESGGLTPGMAEQLCEDVVGVFALPLAVAPNFLINGRETLVPMAIEEPSVVAAAAHAARIVREGGGFEVRVSAPLMVCQIQLQVDDPDAGIAVIRRNQGELLARAAAVDPVLVGLGGGPVGLELRPFPGEAPDPPWIVVHLLVDVRDAMGANVVNSMGEALAPLLERLSGGRAGLRILSNLCDRRLVTCRCAIPPAALSGPGFEGRDVRDRIAAASRFAARDPYRAATHNKGIMNGVDGVVLATANDWRAVEAGAHAWACRGGVYRPLCTWEVAPDASLAGRLEMPLAVGTRGGAVRLHPAARLSLRILRVSSAQELAEVIAAAGMANNLAALRALVTEGIQRGHMRLHGRSRQLAAGEEV